MDKEGGGRGRGGKQSGERERERQTDRQGFSADTENHACERGLH